MRYVIIFLVVFSTGFWCGYVMHKPKVIEKEVEVKVYDFTQEPEKMEMYAEMMHKKLMTEVEIKKLSVKCWMDGYEQGYKEAFLKKIKK